VGYIDEKSYRAAIAIPVTATYHRTRTGIGAPYVAEMVRNLMMQSFGDKSYTGGYQVYTTIDSHQQLLANAALRDGLLAYDQRHGWRGAEQNLGKYRSANMSDWADALSGIPSVSGLIPAAVIAVSDNRIRVLLSDGHDLILDSSDYAWTKKKDAATLVKIGDVVRVAPMQKGRYRLAQIPNIQGALVALNPGDGAIFALVGGFDYNASSFNRVTQAARPAGSAFKPFIYSAALDRGYTLASVFNDAPLVFVSGGKIWQPRNDDREFGGPVRLREALASSINLVSIRVLQSVGLPFTLSYLNRFGFDGKKFPHDLTLALGTGTVSPLEMAVAYAVFANGGFKVSPYLIDRVLDNQGASIYQSHPTIACDNTCAGSDAQYALRVLSAQTAFLMNSALEEVIRSGTGGAAKALGREDIGGKTGTTSEYFDTWFIGFNHDLSTSVWAGFDDPTSVREHGSQVALPIWIDFMRGALVGKPENPMPMPPGIVAVAINPETGLRASGGSTITEYFREDHVPSQDAPAESTAPVVDATIAQPSNDEPLF